MEDTSLYARLLGICSPWEVISVALDEDKQEVLVRAELDHLAELLCPVCSGVSPRYDPGEERRWRHLDSCGFKTYLLARVPRVKCNIHGVRTLAAPWSMPRSRFTLDFECLAIRVLLAVKSQRRAARLLCLSPGQVHDIMHRAVRRGLESRKSAPMQHLSTDEKSYAGQGAYASVLTDLDAGRVLDLCPERTSAAVEELIRASLSPEQMKAVRSVTMDMWDGYVKAVRLVLEDADIVFDRFHVAMYLNDAVDKTRIAEHKRLKSSGDQRLRGSKFFWVKRPENLHPKQIERYGELRQASLETAKAWTLKETFRSFFCLSSPEEGHPFFDQWQLDVSESGNRYMLKVSKMLRRYFYGLVNFIKHRKTNSAAEGVNSRIQEIKFAARGFRRFDAFRIAVLFFLGKLDLYPHKTS